MIIVDRLYRTLAWITFFGCLCWTGIALAFGSAIGRVADPRVMWHVICALGLMLLSLRTIVNATR